MSANGESITSKPIATTMDALTDYLLIVKDSLVKRINPTNAASVLSSLINAASKTPVKTITAASYNAAATDRILICDASSNAITINMPASSAIYDSDDTETATFVVIRTAGSANNVTITPSGSETIDGASSKVISSGSKSVISDGSNLLTHG